MLPPDHSSSSQQPARQVIRWAANHGGLLLFAGLALAAFISVFAPGITHLIQAHLAESIILGIMIGMGIGAALLYAGQGRAK